MSTFNTAIAKCLALLYDYSSTYKVSVELVHHLAQQLKLETFIDKMNYTSNDDPNTQRLSIAGSSILIDIDFLDDKNIISVSISQGPSEDNNVGGTPLSIQTGDINTVTLDVSKADHVKSFLNSSGDESAESILLKNLKSSVLGYFGQNLKYLGTIDTLSSSSGLDLFTFLERVALLLSTISELEGVGKSEDSLINKGYANSVGKVLLNDHSSGRLGLILTYWKKNRYLDEATTSSADEYSILISLVPTNSSNQVEYFPDDDIWHIQDKKYKFNSLGPSISAVGWTVCLFLKDSVPIPTSLIEYWGYAFKSDGKEVNEILSCFNTNSDYGSTLANTTFTFTSGLIEPHFENVNNVSIKRLSDIPQIIKVLRNCLVLDSLCQSVTQASNLLEISPNDDSKQKLRNTLKLSNDVTDEELMGLRALTENSTYVNNPLRRYSEVDSLIVEDTPETETKEDFICLLLNAIDFTGDHDFQLSLKSMKEGSTFSIQFKISNGIISSSNDIQMDDDQSEKFIEVLRTTENIEKALKRI